MNAIIVGLGLVFCGVLFTKINSNPAEAKSATESNEYDMTRVILRDNIYRYENREVICYATGQSGLHCKFKAK